MLHNDIELSRQAAEAIICLFLDATEEADNMKRTRLHHIQPVLITLKAITTDMEEVGPMVDWLHYEMGRVDDWSGMEAEEVRERLERVLAELRS